MKRPVTKHYAEPGESCRREKERIVGTRGLRIPGEHGPQGTEGLTETEMTIMNSVCLSRSSAFVFQVCNFVVLGDS